MLLFLVVIVIIYELVQVVKLKVQFISSDILKYDKQSGINLNKTTKKDKKMKEITSKSIEKGKRIFEVRTKRGYNQEQLSELCGISVAYISKMEQGRVNVSDKTLNKMSTALNCSYEYLEKGIGNPFIEEIKEMSKDKVIEDRIKESSPVRKRPDNNTYIKEIEKSVQKLVTIGDTDTLECFKQVLEWLNDYACNKKLMEQSAPFEVEAYYDNCLRYIDNITEALEYNIAHFQVDFDDDFK